MENKTIQFADSLYMKSEKWKNQEMKDFKCRNGQVKQTLFPELLQT